VGLVWARGPKSTSEGSRVIEIVSWEVLANLFELVIAGIAKISISYLEVITVFARVLQTQRL
jgi:hypothetical protein